MKKLVSISSSLCRIGLILCVRCGLTFMALSGGDVYASTLDCSTASNINVTTGDCEGLLALYDSTNGANRNSTGNRDTDTDVCTWYGVSCTNILGQDRVTSLYSAFNNLSGTLPSDLIKLTELRSISFLVNSISGPLPDSWSGMVNLTFASFGANQISGPLPDSWSTMTNLTNLSFSNNQISGSIPDSWSGMTNMQYFDVSYNQISGLLPDSWSTITSLMSFNAANNNLSGSLPASWSGMVNMQYFNISYNQISGLLPDSWSTMTDLTSFRVNNNNLSGSMPDSWSSWTNIQQFHINNNQLLGELPSSWDSWTIVANFNVSHNYFTGFVPLSRSASRPSPNSPYADFVSNCLETDGYSVPTQTWLDNNSFLLPQNFCLNYTADINGSLSGSTFQAVASGADATSIEALPDPGYIFTQWSDGSTNNPRTDLAVTGGITITAHFVSSSFDCSTASNINVSVSECQALVGLYTFNNGSSWTTHTDWDTDTDVCTWYGVTCADFSGQDNIITLSLPSNNIAGISISTLSNLTHLIYLDLSDNAIASSLPNRTEWADMQYLYLNNNQFSGPLPDSWSGFASIAYIDVSHNSLGGPLPDAWSTLDTMVYFDISDNNFDGGLPDAWSTWTGVQTFYASGGSLTGSLPDSWSALSSMLYFDVSNNSFDGGLPSSWSSWIDVQTLAFHDSSLDGGLPVSWSTMSGLLSLDLSNNNFTGSLPSSRTGMITMTHMDLGHNAIAGSLPSTRSALISLSYLDVGYNQIAGSLPDDRSTLVNMAYFDASSNQIVGNLPNAWSGWTGIQGFYISDNLLTGLIPSLRIASRPNPSSQYIDLTNNCINVSSYPIPILSWISSNVYTSPQNVCLTYSAGTGGTLSGTTFQSIGSGGSGTTVEAISDVGYSFTQWSDGYTGTIRTDTNVTGDITVTAQFSGLTYILTYSADTGGTISGSSIQTLGYGATGDAVEAVADSGYMFSARSDGSTDNPRVDANLTGDIIVTGLFTPLYPYSYYVLSGDDCFDDLVTSTTGPYITDIDQFIFTTYGVADTQTYITNNLGYTGGSDRGYWFYDRFNTNLPGNLTFSQRYLDIVFPALYGSGDIGVIHSTCGIGANINSGSGSNNSTGASSHGGGGGGGSLIIDNCPNGDLSPSYYDASCTISGGSSSGSRVRSTHNVAGSGSQISVAPLFTIDTDHKKSVTDALHTCSSYTGELQRAYCFAGEMGYSIVQEIPLISSDTKVSRSVMASIITRFASSIGGREVDTDKVCLFDDVSFTGSLSDFIHQSCQMNLMGVDVDSMPLPKFHPRRVLKKEEFLTTVSRMLYNHRYEIDPSEREKYTYGYRHIQKLYQQKIIKSTMSKGPATRDFIYLTLYKIVKMLIVAQ